MEKENLNIPEGYTYLPAPSPFMNHIGNIFNRRVDRAGGTEHWVALRIEAHHVNSWNLCHGSVIACLAEIGTAGPAWIADGPPVVAIDLTIQFIGAPKLGELVEVCGTLTKRTRSLVFTTAQGQVDGKPVFVATSIQKILAP